MNIQNNSSFKFEISLSVLNHLGRNLYRNFVTILGEAISNAWDADAENVWIYIDRDANNFVIKDDGIGMNATDFQNKFLKVGYSKRAERQNSEDKERPYIGAKGIGKLALLSCAEKISVITKTNESEYVGGMIDNSGLDEAIKHDMNPDEYSLDNLNMQLFEPYIEGHSKGTVIYFEQTKENIRNTLDYLKKLIALYFRFSLIDESFNIYIEDTPVSLDDIASLSDATEFLWNINMLADPFLDTLTNLKSEQKVIYNSVNMDGFIASVKKPRDLKITGTEEKIGIDLFVNGRLREKDLLKRLPTARIVENYLYGQIHYNELDSDGIDRFTSGREAIVASDSKYQGLIDELKAKIIKQIIDDWDALRLARGSDGDEDNVRKTPKERKALSLYNLSSEEFTEDSNTDIRSWVKDLRPEAEFNIPAYVDCYLSENLIRKYINEQNITLTPPAETEIREWRHRESLRKAEANISFDIRQNNDDLNYLGMDFLAKVVDSTANRQTTASLVRDAIDFKPVRNAVGHTALLTADAKTKLTLVYANIKSRLRTLLLGEDES